MSEKCKDDQGHHSIEFSSGRTKLHATGWGLAAMVLMALIFAAIIFKFDIFDLIAQVLLWMTA